MDGRQHRGGRFLWLLIAAAWAGGAGAADPPATAAAKQAAAAAIDAISAGSYPTAADRERAIVEAALADREGIRTHVWPMNGWTAQLLIKQGRVEEGLGIVRGDLDAMLRMGQARITSRDKAVQNGTYTPLILPSGEPWGEPRYNGFALWSLINVYLRCHQHMDERMKEDFRTIFTGNRSYFGSTGNLSMICTLNLYLAEHVWDPALFPTDGRYGARGPQALPWLTKRAEKVATRGSGEFASRPYWIYNVGTLLSLDNEFTDESLKRRAGMAYEMAVAHAAGTWLRGNWATPAGRTYPGHVTQQIGGSAAMLWYYFGGMTPRLGGQSPAIFAVAEPWRPPAAIVTAATDRSRAYVHRSRFDGEKLFQTSFVNKTYAMFSTASIDGAGIWGQTYPYGVMFDQPDPRLPSICWVTVPCYDDRPLTNWTQGVNSRHVEYLQHRGSLLLVANDLRNPASAPQKRADIKNHAPFSTESWYVLGYVPAGALAVIDDSRTDGRIFLDYGSVLVAISASTPFAWDRAAGVYVGSPAKGDSEFRVFGEDVAVAMESALPDEFPAAGPEERLAAFKTAILARTAVGCERLPGEPHLAKGTYRDRFGATLEKTFHGPALIDGVAVDYASWPLVDNPWMRQDWGGNLVVRDGITERVYDVKNWTITERPLGVEPAP